MLVLEGKKGQMLTNIALLKCVSKYLSGSRLLDSSLRWFWPTPSVVSKTPSPGLSVFSTDPGKCGEPSERLVSSKTSMQECFQQVGPVLCKQWQHV